MRALLCLFTVLLLLAGCGEGSSPGAVAPRLDSNTNWLRYCSTDVPCGELSCTCSICTLPCDPDACAALGAGARCARADEVAILEPSCGGGEVTTSLCVMGCTDDADCGNGRACLMGECIERIAGDGGATGSPCNTSCRMQGNDAAQRCLMEASMSDDDCVATASELLDRCNADCGEAPVTPEQTQARYYGYLCSGGPFVLSGDVAGADDAARICAATDLGNPQLGGLRCLLGDAVVYDSCSGRESGEAQAALGRYVADFCDGVPFVVSEYITREEALENCGLNASTNPGRGVHCVWNDEVLADDCNGASAPTASAPEDGGPPAADDACTLNCRSFADAVITSCRSYGFGDDLCLASGKAQYDSCAGQCSFAGSDPLATAP